MPNELKYNNVTAKSGERVATNGYYTGEHKGSVMQDAKAASNVAHSSESLTVHFGTMTQDAKDSAFPTVVEE